MTLKSLIDAIDKQEEIINLQSAIIDVLFQIVALHLSGEELEKLEVIEKIRRVADMKEENKWM